MKENLKNEWKELDIFVANVSKELCYNNFWNEGNFMSLKAGIVGLPNVGKSTLFNAITKKNILAANYPFATIDPNIGVVTVPDVD